MAPSRGVPKRQRGLAQKENRKSEQEQVRAIYSALEKRDFAALEELAYRGHGFCSAELRRTVWMFLLGLTPEEARNTSWRQLIPSIEQDSQTARTIKADVNRSVFSWDVHTGIRKAARNQKRTDLSEVMHAILLRHPGKLAYFQGFHDIALVFLEVGSTSQAFHMIERLALFHLSDQLCCPFERGLLPLLGAFFFLLESLDAPVAQALEEAECRELHFAVPWILTWYSHSLPKLHQQVMRLFDCLIASHPAMILYFMAALVLHHRDLVLATPREMPDMVCAFQNLKLSELDADEWAMEAKLLAQRLPPEEFMRRLPSSLRRALPHTSPLLNYPHPWRRSGADVANLLDISALAPVYANPASASASSISHKWTAQALLWRVLSAPTRFLAVYFATLVLTPLQKALTAPLSRMLGGGSRSPLSLKRR